MSVYKDMPQIKLRQAITSLSFALKILKLLQVTVIRMWRTAHEDTVGSTCKRVSVLINVILV
jgi:hypothetical protein